MKHLGDKGEAFVKNILTQHNVGCVLNTDKATRYDYDLICDLNGVPFTCEVKFDLKAEQTGNIAMETHNSKKDAASGITVTKATLWVIVLADENLVMSAYSCPVKHLRSWMLANKPAKVVKFGGDKNAVLHIYPKDVILKEFTRLDTFSEADLQQWLLTNIT